MKRYDPRDTDLQFVDADDDHDFLCVGSSSPRALMSCGHSVTPQSLTDWCRRQLDQGKVRYECGVCKAVWPFHEVSKMALLTDEEKTSFENKRFETFALSHLKAKACPGCEALGLRQNPDVLRVRCPQCSAQRGSTYEFCWECLREWSGASSRCANEGCANAALETLRTCPVIKFKSVEGVSGCPSVRACPACGALVKHNSHGCKSIVCAGCKVKFCFVCLKRFSRCSKTSSPYGPCSSGVAPRQTSIPVRK